MLHPGSEWSELIFVAFSGQSSFPLTHSLSLKDSLLKAWALRPAMSAIVPPPPAFPPPQMMSYGVAKGAAASSGSYGPVIAILAVLAVLAAAAVAVGRLCFGRRALGRAGGHDLEAWVERKCGPCVGAGMHSSAPAGDLAKQEEGDDAAELQEQPPEGTERGECSGSGSGSAGGS